MDEPLGFTEVETLMGASSQSQLQASHGSSSSLTYADPTETVSSHKEAREKNVTVAIPGVASSQVEILPNLPEQQPHLDNKLINSFREATKRRLELTQPTLISATGV
ncbi:unnamed protein product [Arabis nemorensis]|uniref:Uncharacterized protein n=1 Tax=Arabis nemorensis TaxID=586526 RepID=A0A565BEM3_9BRAS|nr:unnamed protein product [Arabis nemorensis]